MKMPSGLRRSRDNRTFQRQLDKLPAGEVGG